MHQAPSLNNNAGFTLIEVMVAILIMVVGMFGLLEALSASVQHNTRNQLRDEGIRVGERYMSMLRGKTFTAYSASYTPFNVPSTLRGITKNYNVAMSSQAVAWDASGQPTSMQLSVAVKWAFKNQSSVNRVVTVVAKP
ncbi:MAG TPA: prepilin-type N-terminal cleavage/methylation domain-containing protein [Geomonas sp.]|nr:prepilin-type N-terminal cleavage/methylation domain-containing protein [Geomonas sp.]